MSFLTLDGLGKAYGEFNAVESINLSIERGEFVSLLGPSGCGKTTTLQMVAGFVEPTRGRILLNGVDITRERPEKRGMGIVFQSYALFPHMTVGNNVGFGLDMRNVTRGERAARIAEVLEMVRLTGLDKRYPRELSGGQRQRVAIARALAIRPQVLLLDEPMSNLDAKLREDMHVELRAIQKKLGITTILVTHDQVEAMTMSDRIAVMHGGHIVQTGSPFDAYEKPESVFASGFLGKTNALRGTVERLNERCAEVRVGASVMKVPHGGRRFDGDVQLYVRPERVSLTDSSAADATLQGRVSTCLFLGNHWMLQIDTPLGTVRASLPNLGTTPPREGETVGVHWSDDAVRILAENAHG
ncbi:ABC transporter ATP-binding protein [Paraburkholderia ginsengisoli]|uniref:ABC transporter ATP-binding protein n=1 Tax=Paraburkholderia ginsengisoli TaxID=311231 RepID=A0A7T4N6W6_9BURK|nr:ABC transporter ATP-binding protein [Paraburkholderia ginsengisoli]QQC66339.1 ABC transporter ATP-binding protein [Paraburkholderia ginsengisoli]